MCNNESVDSNTHCIEVRGDNMIIFGYAKEYRYTNDSTLMIRVRVPSIHGPYSLHDANGQLVRNYVNDADLPFYQSLLLPHLPGEGDVVALSAMDSSSNDFLVIGLTGASYSSGVTNV